MYFKTASMFHYNFFFFYNFQFYHNCDFKLDCFYIYDQIMAKILLSFWNLFTIVITIVTVIDTGISLRKIYCVFPF